MPNTVGSLARRYGAAVLSVAAATGVRQLLEPLLRGHSPFTLFFLAVLCASWLGGFGPGVVAIALGSVSASYFFLEPRGSLLIDRPEYEAGMMLYVAVGVVVALFGQALRAARRRLAETEGRGGGAKQGSG